MVLLFLFMHLLMKGVQLPHRVAIVDHFGKSLEDYLGLNTVSVVAPWSEVPHKPIFHTVHGCFDGATFLRYLEATHTCHACFF